MSDIDGTYDDFLKFMESLVASIIPNHVDSYKVYGDENKQRLRIVIEFSDESPIGLLFGFGKEHLKALLIFARAQQIYSHDRFILLEVVKPDGSVQRFANKNCAALRHYESKKTDEQGNKVFDNSSIRARALHRSFMKVHGQLD